MRAKGPTFWLLDASHWERPENSVSREDVAVDSRGLRLAAAKDPNNPLAINSRDESAGQLGLPRGIALDSTNDIYLLDSEDASIKRFDRSSGEFLRLENVGGYGSEARQFIDPSNLSIAGRNLYVADRGNRRVQVFALPLLSLRHIWQPLDAADVASAGGSAYVLDSANGRVLWHRPGTDELKPVVSSQADAGRWSRLLVDQSGRIYLLDKANSTLAVYSAARKLEGTITDSGDVRDQFSPPPLKTSHSGLIELPGGSFFDRQGRKVVVHPDGPLGTKMYPSKGVWMSAPLDSQMFRCQWHRVELEAELPPGAKIVVSTATDSVSRPPEEMLASAEVDWSDPYEFVSPLQANDDRHRRTEFLVQSRPGRYLWLRLELHGDGYATPSVRRLWVHYPRSSYLKYLPAIYGENEEGREFLETFLSVFQTEWDSLEKKSAQIERYFDPCAVPGGPSLDWLAEWLAFPLERSWTAEQKRMLLQAAPQIHPKLGTVEGVRRYVNICLKILAEAKGRSISDAFPVFLEGFRERRQMISLSRSSLSHGGTGVPLWSTATIARLQLGDFSREGEARLVSVGDPGTDFFRTYAHRFQVLVPDVCVQTQADEAILRRAIEEVKPAHTSYDLRVLAPRFRVGVQSSVGLDSIIGEHPTTRLVGLDEHGTETNSDGHLRGASLPPSSRLGYDTVLADEFAGHAGFRLSRGGVQVGVGTVLR